METTAAQQRLLEAAVDAFAERGFGATTTRDIASRAGRSPAAVYVHHASKEELLYAISLMGHRDALDCLREAAASTTQDVQRLHTMVFEFSLWHIQHAKRGRVVQYELHALSEPHRDDILALRREFQSVMVDVLTAGAAAGTFEIEDVPGTARALLSLSVDLVRWFDPALSRDPEAVARLNADLALRMVGAHAHQAPARTQT